jgi:hypothetical protein
MHSYVDKTFYSYKKWVLHINNLLDGCNPREYLSVSGKKVAMNFVVGLHGIRCGYDSLWVIVD